MNLPHDERARHLSILSPRPRVIDKIRRLTLFLLSDWSVFSIENDAMPILTCPTNDALCTLISHSLHPNRVERWFASSCFRSARCALLIPALWVSSQAGFVVTRLLPRSVLHTERRSLRVKHIGASPRTFPHPSFLLQHNTIHFFSFGYESSGDFPEIPRCFLSISPHAPMSINYTTRFTSSWTLGEPTTLNQHLFAVQLLSPMGR
ncbi:hypothetical protein B0H19DRAFT_559825 [Mycena capillaripes]|nr:hypothetical protein B0H19DRAFT_559825 [Mycena capillaripes]